ncbi:MAG: thymidylate synthase [Bacteroidales bacterium]
MYLNHLDQVKEQMGRQPYPLPVMKINPDRRSIFDFVYSDFSLEGYVSHPHIKGEIAV